jgi:hypothetical protein
LATGAVSALVMQGDPGAVESAAAELVSEALEEMTELDLETFLSCAPGDGSLE